MSAKRTELNTLTFEVIEDEIYIVLNNETVGRIREIEGYTQIIWESGESPTPFQSTEDAKQYVRLLNKIYDSITI